MSTISQLHDIFARNRFRHTNEIELQDGIAKALTDAGLAFKREHHLGVDRVDFFLDGIALEVKIGGSLSDVTRQLHRYSEHTDVHTVALVTTMARHRPMPVIMSGKPVLVFHLIGSVL